MKNYFSVLVSLPDSDLFLLRRNSNLDFVLQVNKLDNILDTERAWDDFFGDIVGEHWSTEDSARYIRLNPDLKSTPPALDQKEMLETLHRRTQKLLQADPALVRQVEDVTNRLVASSFYFRKLKIENDNGGFTCSGKLATGTSTCSFPANLIQDPSIQNSTILHTTLNDLVYF